MDETTRAKLKYMLLVNMLLYMQMLVEWYINLLSRVNNWLSLAIWRLHRSQTAQMPYREASTSVSFENMLEELDHDDGDCWLDDLPY